MASLDDPSDMWDEELDAASQVPIDYVEPPRREPRSFQRNRHGGQPLEFDIEYNQAGRIIGRGGSKIQELQRESGSSIEVDNSGSVPKVRIFGTPEAQSKAKQLIDDMLCQFTKLNVSVPAAKKEYEPLDWDKVRENMKRAEEEKIARFEALPPIQRNFYREHPDVANLTPNEIKKMRLENNNIIVSPLKEGDVRRIPNPVATFEHAFEPYPEILSELRKVGFKKPSPIQCQAWPILMKGYDMVGIAQTGTGKTIAFLLPALIHIDNQIVPRKERLGPTCLVLAPTRELALQIFEETKKYHYRGIRSTCIYGGRSRKGQSAELEKGVEIIIATPGRLMDFIGDNTLDVISVTYLVIDEADRMLDLGFEKDLRIILSNIRPDRQTVMTSATWPLKVQEISEKYMNDPIRVHVSSLNLVAAHSVDQQFVFCDDDLVKKQILFEFVETMNKDDKVLVFVERRGMVDDIASDIVLKYKMECAAIQGGYEQCDREQALEDFKTGFSRILVATDVASRGLDVQDVTHVFNMSLPREMEDYVHRIGRTGRAGKYGTAITIISYYDYRRAPELIKLLEEANQEVPQQLYRMAAKQERKALEKRDTQNFRPRQQRWN